MRGRGAPAPSPVPRQELLSRRRPATRFRPQTDWVEVQYPHLTDYLPADVRAVAIERQRADQDGQRDKRVAQPRRRSTSDYILTGVLRSLQGGALSGVPKGNGNYRYYRDARAHQAPVGDSTARRMMRAQPVEAAVLEVVQTVLSHVPNLRYEVERQVRDVLREEETDRRQLDELRGRRDTLKRQAELAVAHADLDQPDLFTDAIARLKAQYRQLSDRIASVEQQVGAVSTDVDELVEETLVGLAQLGQTLAAAPPASLTELIRILVPRLVVDLATKDIAMEVHLPAYCDQAALMGLPSVSSARNWRETHSAAPGFRFTYALIWNDHAKTYERQVQVEWDLDVETDWDLEFFAA
jgi:cell division protein FtsB